MSMVSALGSNRMHSRHWRMSAFFRRSFTFEGFRLDWVDGEGLRGGFMLRKLLFYMEIKALIFNENLKTDFSSFVASEQSELIRICLQTHRSTQPN